MNQPAVPELYEMQLTQEDVTKNINQFLGDFFDKNITRSKLLDANYAQLWQVMHQQAMAGGKRLRPYFVLLAYCAFGGKIPEAVMPVAAAHELLHISLLMHDDIIDKDYVRHGQANVAGVMRDVYQSDGAGNNSEHFANGAALLAGDLLISSAYQLISDSQLVAEQKLAAMGILADAIFLVAGGQLLDTETNFRTLDVDDPLKIADLKTARYSFVAPLVTGAVLAGADKEQQDMLEELGIALGIAFQLADDLLGMYGDPVVTGKSNISDIREGKQTYMMLQALKLASPADRAALQMYLGKQEVTDAQATEVREILIRSGAKATCVQKIAIYTKQVEGIIEKLAIPAEYKTAFQAIVQKSTQRVL